MKSKQPFSSMMLLVSLVVIFSMVLSGCTTVAGVSATPTETASPVPTDTPMPTSTSTPVPTDTPTSTPTVTRTATPDRKATQAFKQTATQAAVNERVNAELAKLGIDSSQGHVAWVMQEPVELDGSGYAMGWYNPIKDLGVVKDFVIQSDVTWNTSGALAGCAYIVRAPKDWDLKTSDFYDFWILRNKFDPVWGLDYFQDGRWQYSLPTGRGASSGNINDEEMSTNTLTLEARGENFTVYINGVKERTVQNNKVAEGRIAFEVVQNSGSSYCKFENGWVWAYDK